MSFEEKIKTQAKTLEQWLYGNQCTSLNEIMVSLDVVLKAWQDFAKSSREEEKQKLQQLLKEFPCSKCSTWKDNECTETRARSHKPYAKWFLKFKEEVLKEKES